MLIEHNMPNICIKMQSLVCRYGGCCTIWESWWQQATLSSFHTYRKASHERGIWRVAPNTVHCHETNNYGHCGSFDKRFSHHSAQRGKYYTNRFYMKKCKACALWNNLSVMQCVHCLTALGDEDIRLRVVDPLCRTANSRRGETENGTVEYVMLHRCFDFTIMVHPQPSAAIHLSAVPNGTFYDIKNFRKTHVPMITKMKSRCDAIIHDVITGHAGPDYLKNSVSVNHLRGIIQAPQRGSKRRKVSDIVSEAIYGFNYPNNFSHVGMHAIVPPIKCFNLFKSPFFYPLSKVLSDLEHLSQVKAYTADEAKQLYEKDIIMEEIVDIDATFRAQYGF
ncbi:hypothetical protein, conserved [Babesia bigemina]|uniref:Uncharacterized protein n=1 Tax=Babesia bigemina TaxID=5866 RepID=A0A061DCX2_BABBI|nr:hypothetical protein, conserved [Babesia bigemina]CDR96954.1 hypothetical protein, conserved [Babesia bigemina]|eukprot:XP_012769140.1 hypothetical protein, conserved [Babesia bigemina]